MKEMFLACVTLSVGDLSRSEEAVTMGKTFEHEASGKLLVICNVKAGRFFGCYQVKMCLNYCLFGFISSLTSLDSVVLCLNYSKIGTLGQLLRPLPPRTLAGTQPWSFQPSACSFPEREQPGRAGEECIPTQTGPALKTWLCTSFGAAPFPWAAVLAPTRK